MSIHVVTGTDTGIGKTVFAAGLAAALGAHYWKPIQAGVEPDGDKEEVARLSGLPASHILPEAYRLNTPASPHLAARIDGVEISLDRLALPQVDGPLVIEGAGGVLVPVNEQLLMADLFAPDRQAQGLAPAQRRLFRPHRARHDQPQPAQHRSAPRPQRADRGHRLHRRTA